jgi:WD40 repeat protein
MWRQTTDELIDPPVACPLALVPQIQLALCSARRACHPAYFTSQTGLVTEITTSTHDRPTSASLSPRIYSQNLELSSAARQHPTPLSTSCQPFKHPISRRIFITDLSNLPTQYTTILLGFHHTTRTMASALKGVPLVAPGHTRPVTHLSYSNILEDGTYLLISGCKDGNPMLREWTGDWIGTFLGHKGAVWSTKLSPDASRAASASADFTA